jgi:hypothetical protein
MAKTQHKVETNRKLITDNELAEWFSTRVRKVHTNTMKRRINEYGKLNKKNVYSILDFIKWLLSLDNV